MNLPKLPLLAKIFLGLFIAISILTMTRGVFAANDYYQKKQAAVKKGGNQEAWLDSALGSNIVSGGTAIHGEIPEEVLSGNTIFWQPTGAMGASTNLIASLYTPPASGVQYVAETWGNFLGKPAYAQGTGYYGLRPFLPIWRSFRNTIYVLSSLFFVIIGLMIMLRIKISPQAVINLQNSIPQLFFTLILVTFSYAIAGFLIDISIWIQSIGAVIIWPDIASSFYNTIMAGVSWVANYIIPGNQPDPNPLTLDFYHVVNPNFFTLQYMLFIPSVLVRMLGTALSTLLGTVLGIAAAIGTAGNPLAGIAVGLGVAGVGGALISLIFSILLLIWIIKFFLGLFRVYATIIFKIIIAPLEIGMGAFPNSKMGFKSWIWDMIANLAVFPISFLFLLLASKIIVEIGIGSAANAGFSILDLLQGKLPQSGLWTPSLLTVPGLPVGNIIAIGSIAVGTLTLLSKLPDMIPQYIFMIKPSDWGSAIGKSSGESAAFIGGAVAAPFRAGNQIAEEIRNRNSKVVSDIAEAPQGVRPSPKTGPENEIGGGDPEFGEQTPDDGSVV